MANIQDSLRQREARRRHPFPVSLEPGNVEQDIHINREKFIQYYTSDFHDDLKQFYDIKESVDKTFSVVLNMTCIHNFNARRLHIQWRGLNHFYMFSVSVYFMTLCTQVVGKLFGWLQMENFMRASGWPLMSCGLGGLMHPIQIILESELFPQNADTRYFEILHAAGGYLTEDFLDFLKGDAANLNYAAYNKLCNEVKSLDAIEQEIKAQTSLFERWISDPDTKYPGLYVKYAEEKHQDQPEKPSQDISPNLSQNKTNIFDWIRNHKQEVNVSTYLSHYKEEIPNWLQDYNAGSDVRFSDIMSGRVGYYPGSGYDGTLMKVANKSHTVHSFLYVDCGISKKDLTEHLADPYNILGYHRIGRIEWSEKDLMPNGQYPLNVNKRPLHNQDPNWFVDPKEKPYCFTDIMERDSHKDDTWGAERFAITFLFADGIATYYQLFCMEYKKAPWIMLLQDYAFGGNYDRFGKGGILDAIIAQNDIRPDFVLCADNTRIWDGYTKVNNVCPEFLGLLGSPRFLYENAKGQ